MFSKWQYVYELYKEQSFTKAAKKLFISQPSLSEAIKNVENKVGAQLFERTGQGIELTEIGREYIVAAEQISETENEFKKKLADIYNLESGEIIVGGSNYVSSYILPKIILEFGKLHPNISIRIEEANSNNLRNMLLGGAIDMAIDNINENSELTKYTLCKEKIFLCVPKDNKINEMLEKHQIKPENIRDSDFVLDNIEPVSIEIFKNDKFILLKNENDMYMRALNIFKKGCIEPKIVFKVDQLNISYALTDSGVGLCFITDTFFKYAHHHENVVLYRIAEAFDERILCIAHKTNKYCSNAMSEFMNIAKESFKTDFL